MQLLSLISVIYVTLGHGLRHLGLLCLRNVPFVMQVPGHRSLVLLKLSNVVLVTPARGRSQGLRRVLHVMLAHGLRASRLFTPTFVLLAMLALGQVSLAAQPLRSVSRVVRVPHRLCLALRCSQPV